MDLLLCEFVGESTLPAGSWEECFREVEKRFGVGRTRRASRTKKLTWYCGADPTLHVGKTLSQRRMLDAFRSEARFPAFFCSAVISLSPPCRQIGI